MAGIIDELRELEDSIIRCMKCGTCQAVCPLYRKDLVEPSVARGKIALIESVYEGRLEKAGDILKHLEYCVLCGRCRQNCPSDVKTDEIFLKARAVLKKIKKMPGWQKGLLGFVMDHPEQVTKLLPFIHVCLRIGSRRVGDDVLRPLMPLMSERNVVSVKKEPFVRKYKGLNYAENERMRVLYYPGCSVNYVYTNWGKAVVETLKYFGVSVYVPEVVRCCGIPAATMGDIELYRKMVNLNFDYFAAIGTDYVITSCPTCEYGLKEMGGRETKRESPFRIVDILVFLDEVLKIDFTMPFDKKISLHLPCHYDCTHSDLPGRFLQRHFSSNYIPLENTDCCGFGGTFSLKYYRNSKEIALAKAVELRDKRIDTLFIACPGCAMHLTDAVVSAGCETGVLNPIEVLYEGIRKGSGHSSLHC